MNEEIYVIIMNGKVFRAYENDINVFKTKAKAIKQAKFYAGRGAVCYVAKFAVTDLEHVQAD